jgi:REP element-mobilizing transposase RayT
LAVAVSASNLSVVGSYVAGERECRGDCRERAWLIDCETMSDRVRPLMGVDPRFGVYRLVKAAKRRLSRSLCTRFRWLKPKLLS